MIFLNKVYKKILNIPIVWNLAQNILGANQYKHSFYRLVFDGEKKGRLLDFGCSIGNTTGDFLDFDYYGIDNDSVAIEGAKKRWAGQKNVAFLTLDILKED